MAAVSRATSSDATRGLVGLGNLGNTCFMNAALQCLGHTVPLRNYFLSGSFRGDINKSAPKTRGKLGRAFGELVVQMWAPQDYVVPDVFKRQIGAFADQFAGTNQQDLQEFLRFLLDGLHEDLNRVKNKAEYRELDDDASVSDAALASDAWDYYQSRENSRISDVFMGQLVSHIDCQACGRFSRAFDPFMDLSLPIPTDSRGRPVSSCTIHDCLEEYTKVSTGCLWVGVGGCAYV